LLVESARRRSSQKRGSGHTVVTFDEAIGSTAFGEDEVIKLDTALTELERLNPRHAAVGENRFFGGLEVAETAALLEVAEATSPRDWRAAKAWLAHELRTHR